MNAIIPTWVFYVIQTISEIKFSLDVIIFIGTIVFIVFSIFCGIVLFDNTGYELDENEKATMKAWRKSAVILAASWLLVCFLPSEKTMYTMLANSFITPNNIESFKGDAKDLVDYVFDKFDEKKGDE